MWSRENLAAFIAAVLLLGLVGPGRATTYQVLLASDAGNTWTADTLRWAVACANADTTAAIHDIDLNLPAAQGNTLTLVTAAGNLLITHPVNFRADPANHIVLRGAGSSFGPVFWTGSDGSIVSGLSFIDFPSAAIYLASSNNLVCGCRVGTGWKDETGQGNGYGVQVSWNCSHNTIGLSGTTTVISGNLLDGIHADKTSTLAVKNCLIGTTADGQAALPNGGSGVRLGDIDNGAPDGGSVNCLIGGSYAADRNVISGNNGSGVLIENGTTTNKSNPTYTRDNGVSGNIIGMKADLSGPLSNAVYGVALMDSSGNRVGDGGDAQRHNVIAGNLDSGVVIFANPGWKAENNRVQNNEIGLAHGVGIGNGTHGGVRLVNAGGNLIGGSLNQGSSWESNVISGHFSGFGISLESDSSGNTISGNLLGLDAAGSTEISNDVNLQIVLGSHNLVGGSNTAGVFLGNVSAGNIHKGIWLVEGKGNTVCGNLVGLNQAGTAAVNPGHPLADGIRIDYQCIHTLIGGPGAAWGNVISGNGYRGLWASNVTDCVIAGNRFGTTADGLGVVSNGWYALELDASSARVGGSSVPERNLVCGASLTTGIEIAGAPGDSSGSTITGNFIGVLADGSLPVAAADRLAIGVHLDFGSRNTAVGLKGSAPSSNLIAGAWQCIDVTANALGHGFFGNTICAFGSQGIVLEPGANNSISAPVILAAVTTVSGTSGAGDFIEVFLAEGPAGRGGSLKSLGTGTADGTGHWTVAVSGVLAGQYVCALATDTSSDSSEFSSNVLYGPPNMPTLTPSPTITPTQVVTPNPLANVDLGGKSVLVFPNPAREQAFFLLDTDQGGDVKAQVFNIYGDRVAEIEATLSPGRGQAFAWDCRKAQAGIYVVRVTLSDPSQSSITRYVVRVAVAR